MATASTGIKCVCGSVYFGSQNIQGVEGRSAGLVFLAGLLTCAECGAQYVFRPGGDSGKPKFYPVGSKSALQAIQEAEIEALANQDF